MFPATYPGSFVAFKPNNSGINFSPSATSKEQTSAEKKIEGCILSFVSLL